MILKKLRFKNFFSAGNCFIEIDLQKYKKSVITGKNGHGKSTINSAITFALFNKTIKQVTRSLIVNSINNKNCLVEIEFSVGTKEYLVRRGIKPNIFEIIEDGVLVDQSSVTDYQDHLEEVIMKSSYRTFLQTSVISIENYKPFMSLTKAERRDFIEDILDIKVFSMMNQLIKSKVSKNKEELRILDVKFKSIREKILLQKAHIEQLESIQTEGIESLDAKLQEYEKEVREAETEIELVSKEIAPIKELQANIRKKKEVRDQILSDINTNKTKLRAVDQEISYFGNTDQCLTCRQDLEETHVNSIVDTATEVKTKIEKDINSLYSDLKEFINIDKELESANENLTRCNTKISTANSTISRMNRLISDVDKEKNKLSVSNDVIEQKESMKSSAKEALVIKDKQTELNTEQDYNLLMLELFKDSGIKSKIVDQYIPVINKLVNQYLDKMEFFVGFTLDSEFNEVIKSRHRDEFVYNSFSAGEKIRIDIALLFTFRQLAKMKSAFSTNILVLDEIMDASADAEGIELIMCILEAEEFESTNIMVISHSNSDRFEDRFDGHYSVTKRDGFTQIEG